MNRPVTLSSTISAKVTKLPYIGKPDSKLAQVRSHEVLTQIVPRDLGVKPDIIPLWIVVLAAVAGTAILLLLVFLLYKVINFKIESKLLNINCYNIIYQVFFNNITFFL